MLIGDKYKIESTKLQYTIFEKTSRIDMLVEKLVEEATTNDDSDIAERIDSEGWRPVAYFGSLRASLKWLLEREVKASGMTDLQTILMRIEQIYLLIDAADVGMPKADVKQEMDVPG